MYILQIISLAIYAIVMIGALYDFKRTVLIWVPMSLLFSPQWCVTYSSPITALSVAVDLSLVFYYILFCTRYETKFRLNNERFCFFSAIGLMTVSYLLSTLFSDMPFGSSFNRLIKTTIESFGMILILFRCLNTKSDVILFTKALFIAAFIFCTNGIVEGIVRENYWGNFMYYTSRCDEVTLGRGWHYPYSLTGHFNERFGMIRCYSVFQLHLVFGFACCLTLYILMIMLKEKQQIFKKYSRRFNNGLYTILMGMLAISIIMCNSKGPMLMVIVILLTQYRFSTIFNFKIISSLVLLLIIISIYFPDYILNFVSLTDEEVAEEGGGSSVALREEQFEAALSLFSRHPLFGNGINSVSFYRDKGFEEISGAESAWLKILPDQGLFGVIAYLYMYFILKKQVEHIIPFKTWFFFLLAVFLFDTTNGSAYTRLIWWIGILFAARRYYQLKILKKW